MDGPKDTLVTYGYAQTELSIIWLSPERITYYITRSPYIFDISPYLAIFSFILLIYPSFYSHLVYLMVSPYISPCLFHISYISHISLYLLISFYISSYLIISDYILYIPVYLSIPHYIWFCLTIPPHISPYLITIRHHMAGPKDNLEPYVFSQRQLSAIWLCLERITYYMLYLHISFTFPHILEYLPIYYYICLYLSICLYICFFLFKSPISYYASLYLPMSFLYLLHLLNLSVSSYIPSCVTISDYIHYTSVYLSISQHMCFYLTISPHLYLITIRFHMAGPRYN